MRPKVSYKAINIIHDDIINALLAARKENSSVIGVFPPKRTSKTGVFFVVGIDHGLTPGAMVGHPGPRSAWPRGQPRLLVPNHGRFLFYHGQVGAIETCNLHRIWGRIISLITDVTSFKPTRPSPESALPIMHQGVTMVDGCKKASPRKKAR